VKNFLRHGLLWAHFGLSLAAWGSVSAPHLRPLDEIRDLQWSFPALNEETRRPLQRALAAFTRALGNLQGDVVDRFSKCDSDKARLAQKGQALPTLSLPYPAALGKLRILRNLSLELEKDLDDAQKKIDAATVKRYLWVLIRYAWNEKLVDEIHSPGIDLAAAFDRVRRGGGQWDFTISENAKLLLEWQLRLHDLDALTTDAAALAKTLGDDRGENSLREFSAQMRRYYSPIFTADWDAVKAQHEYVGKLVRWAEFRVRQLSPDLAERAELNLGDDDFFEPITRFLGRAQYLKGLE
jgi:hypothetical protein